MNQKGFIKIVLVSLIIVVASVFFWPKKYVPRYSYLDEAGNKVLSEYKCIGFSYTQGGGELPGDLPLTHYCLGFPYQTATNKVSVPISTPKDETANWKTTTNVSLGYSIKYPNGWKAETNNFSTTLTNLSNSEQVITIELNSTNANPNRLSINEWLKTQQWPDPKPISEQFKSIATVGGVSAVEQSQTGTVYFTKDTNVFVVSNGVGFTRKVVDEKLFLQILSTFKFTN